MKERGFAACGNCHSPCQGSKTVKDPTASGSDGVR